MYCCSWQNVAARQDGSQPAIPDGKLVAIKAMSLPGHLLTPFEDMTAKHQFLSAGDRVVGRLDLALSQACASSRSKHASLHRMPGSRCSWMPGISSRRVGMKKHAALPSFRRRVSGAPAAHRGQHPGMVLLGRPARLASTLNLRVLLPASNAVCHSLTSTLPQGALHEMYYRGYCGTRVVRPLGVVRREGQWYEDAEKRRQPGWEVRSSQRTAAG